MILIILLVSFLIRLIVLDQSLWLDEAINVNAASTLSLKSLLLEYSIGDFHPPLFHALLKGWISVFGQSEIAVRLPSVVFGVLTVFMTYLIGKILFERKTALIAATLLATAPLHIYYSQEARMYMLACFLTSVSVYFFLSIIKKDNLASWLGFVISTTLLLYTDYLPYLMVLVFAAFFIFLRKGIAKNTFVAFIPSFISIFFLLIPWLIIFPKQLGAGLSSAAASPAWAQVVGSTEIKSLLLVFVKFSIGRISHDNNLLYALLFAPIAVFGLFLFSLSIFRLSRLRSFLLFWFFIPIALAYSVSFFIPVFTYFRLLFILPAFYLIWAAAINTVNASKPTRILLALALLINLGSSIIYFTSPKFHREDWKTATLYVHQNANDNAVVLFELNYTLAPYNYYNEGKVPAYGALDSFNPDSTKVRENVTSYTLGKDKVFLFQYLSAITDPKGLLFKELTMMNFKNVKTKDFQGVGFVYEFTR